jgi:hypothetical protein
VNAGSFSRIERLSEPFITTVSVSDRTVYLGREGITELEQEYRKSKEVSNSPDPIDCNTYFIGSILV